MASESSRPLLLPQNRRVSHLKGIYIRNITVARPDQRSLDDAEINFGFEKSAKESLLEHSHSSKDLRRPSQARRRSTAWSTASPAARQKKLEDVIDRKLVDTFFTIHCDGHADPVYISEVVERAMNPTFRLFDMSSGPPAAIKLNAFTIKVWVKQHEYSLFLEQKISLQKLYFTKLMQPLPNNCIIFHLTDGMYATDRNLAIDIPPPKPAPSLPTSSYSALMKLSMLDESIQDAINTQEQLASQINEIIQNNPPDEVPAAQDKARLATQYVTAERKLLKQAQRRRAELVQSISARRKFIQDGYEAQNLVQKDIDDALEKLERSKASVKTTTEDIHGQRRRICEDLGHIFPLEPTKTPLLFTIRGLPLPNSSFDEADEDVVAAALGLVARLVDMLQYYLAKPIPYPVKPFGSRSIIQDQISILPDNQRVFPLYTKGTIRFRFDYAVFLLNKDIECLAESQGLKVMDIRQTLPNLKYLLYVCSAGNGELPTRKAGGVRGLLSGRGTPASSRRNSDASNQGDAARRALEDGSNGVISSTLASAANQLLPSSDHHRSLRTSGLRENISS